MSLFSTLCFFNHRHPMTMYRLLYWHPENEEPEYIDITAESPTQAEEQCRELFQESTIRILSTTLKGASS